MAKGQRQGTFTTFTKQNSRTRRESEGENVAVGADGDGEMMIRHLERIGKREMSMSMRATPNPFFHKKERKKERKKGNQR